MRLVDQLGLGKSRYLDKRFVEKDQLALGVRLRDDQNVVTDRIFDVGDGKVLSHGRTPGT
jgi:hypothetical protein